MSDFLVTKCIFGHLPSMKNQRRIVQGKHGKPISIKSKDAMEYAEAFAYQIKAKDKIKYAGPVSLRARIWYRSPLSDLDEAFLMDLLQKNEIILNDRQVKHKDITHAGVDRENPRLIFSIYPYADSKGGVNGPAGGKKSAHKSNTAQTGGF